MLPDCYLLKQATNAWQQKLQEGKLGPYSRTQLRSAGLLGGRTDETFKRLPQRYNENVIPFQSPAIPSRMRKAKSIEASQHLAKWNAHPSAAYAKQNPLSYNLTTEGIMQSMYEPTEHKITVPPNRFLDFPGVRRKTLAHELGHAIDFQRGTRANGSYTLDDRLMVHKLEKRAPGIIMGFQSNSPATMIDEVNAEKFAINAVKPGIKEENALTRILSHLRNNYSGNAPYRNALEPLLTKAHGLPFATQVRVSEPIQRTALKLLSKFRK